MAAVDRDLSQHDAELAEHATLLPGLDMRLVRIDEEKEVDEYHVLQGLRDGSKDASDPKCCYAWQRWGSTGSRGTVKLDGPWEQSKVEALLAKTFRELTGAELGSLAVGARAPGRFWLQHASQPDLKARWKYYVADGVDGKQKGWYPYTPVANEEVEEVYAQHVANAGVEGSHIRWVRSGHFTYKVDLSKMTQENTRTHKQRTIRRSFSDVVDAKRPSKKKTAPKKATVLKRPAAKPAIKGMTVMAKPAAAVAGKKAAVRKLALRGKLGLKAKKLKEKKGKAMKAKKPRKWGSKAEVLKGEKERTKTGLRKADIVLNRKGKCVCRSRSEGGKRNGIKNIRKWVSAFNEAKDELGLHGFVPCKKGTRLYDRTRQIWRAKL